MRIEITKQQLTLATEDDQDSKALTAIRTALCAGHAILIRTPTGQIVLNDHKSE